MKLKTSSETAETAGAPTSGGAVIADRFKLEPVAASAAASAGVNKTAAAIALVASLAAAAMIGAVAAMMYLNWDLIASA